jgi:hypothetical protein
MKRLLFAGVVAAGLLAGLLGGMAATDSPRQSSMERYCSALAEGYAANESNPGTVACFPSAAGGGNSTLEKNSEAECLCLQKVNGSRRVFEVRRSG